MPKELEVIAGPMNSGKSTELIRELKRRQIAGQEVLVIKPKLDNRSTEKIVSKDGPSLPAIETEDTSELILLTEAWIRDHPNKEYVLGIDEAQFFDDSLPGAIKYITSTLNCQVIAAGLPRDFRGEPFGPMPYILAMAQHVTSLFAICTFKEGDKTCGRPASETYRSINGKPANFNDPIVLVGDQNEGYGSRCVEHHLVKNPPNPLSYPHTK